MRTLETQCYNPFVVHYHAILLLQSVSYTLANILPAQWIFIINRDGKSIPLHQVLYPTPPLKTFCQIAKRFHVPAACKRK